jgi:phosphocarrier protein HPr
MKEFKVTCTNEHGLHMRPAMFIMDAALQFESDIVLVNKGKEASAKSIVEMLVLSISKGDEVIIRAEGPDEDEAVHEIRDMIAKEIEFRLKEVNSSET